MGLPAVVVLVRFRSRLSLDEVTRIAAERADEFRELAGLEQKYYLYDEATDEYAGLYVWRSTGDLAAYQDSELRASIAEVYQVEGEPRVAVYRVVDVLHDKT